MLANSRNSSARQNNSPSRCDRMRIMPLSGGVRGEPRGRKSDAGPGATNPVLPAQVEGGKRVRSATRNP